MIGMALQAGALITTNAQVVGPMIGQTSSTSARFLYRPDGEIKTLRLSVLDQGGSVVGTDTTTNRAADDYVAKFHVTGLSPSTAYRYQIDQIAGDGSALPIVGGNDEYRFRTFPAPGQRAVFTAAFASCANATSEPVWGRISALNVNALFLMGDTPYIDTTDQTSIFTKERAFLNTPNLKNLVQQTPTAATWDDHDFGLNNGNGINVPLKANTRKGFVSYRAHDQYGTGNEGIYTKVHCGPVEIFLIDDRWFTQTTTSPVKAGQPTFFGSAQWNWLIQGLRQSNAPFKILAFGAIWQDKKNTENDDMFTYWYERDALLDYIRDQKIPGVTLLGGDIHVSRYLMHSQRCGYDLHDFVSSPAHSSVIPSLDVYHPDLEWSSQLPQQFMTITVDTRVQPATLVARFYKSDGTVQRTVSLNYDQLVPKSGVGLAKELCGYWPFDQNQGNRSVLGTRTDATSVNGAALTTLDSARAGAVRFTRANNQYLKIGRSILPDNAAEFTVSLWAKPTSLPAHGSSELASLLESTPDGNISSKDEGYSLSLRIGPGTTSDKVALTLYTYTLKPAAASQYGTGAPTPLAQGPFSAQVDRSLLLNQWSNISYTFDSAQLRLFVNGQAISTFPLPTPGPLAENGGLILGGHRAGTGRNFDGLLDEVAIWSRVLEDSEINTLWNHGTAAEIPTAVSAIDSDGDTLPDWWELTNQLDPMNPSDAISDSDGDKIPAFIEYAMGTSPTFDDSVFYQYVRNLASPGSSDTETTFKNPADQRANLQLVLESSTDLQNWTSVPLGTPGTGVEVLNNLLKLKLPPTGAQQRFYRFRAKAAQP